MKGEFKRLSVEEEQGVYDANARLMLEKQARRRAEKSGGGAEQDQYIASDMVLHAIEDEKARVARQRRADVDKFNEQLKKEKKDFDTLERKAYKSYEHVEPYTSTANLC